MQFKGVPVEEFVGLTISYARAVINQRVFNVIDPHDVLKDMRDTLRWLDGWDVHHVKRNFPADYRDARRLKKRLGLYEKRLSEYLT